MKYKTLLLTDIHLSNKSIKGVSLIESQVGCLLDIIKKEKADEIIIMGDIFMQRKPSPTALMALQEIITFSLDQGTKDIIMLRGNHDSETKADDGVTALKVFEAHKGVRVIEHTHVSHDDKRVYIPHYEIQGRILKALREAPKDYTLFGHFGFVGCLNSVGDKDFDIPLKEFKNRTYLGHIHKHYTSWSDNHPVTVVGTPYTTNFGEEGQLCYYGVKTSEEDDFTFKEILAGPRHLVIKYKDFVDNFESYKELINTDGFSNLIRFTVGKDDKVDYSLLDKLSVIYIDFKFSPLEEKEQQDQSEYTPPSELFSINDQIIEDYVDKHNTSLDREDIMWGLSTLKDEDR